ncbi:Adenosine monophosphate-protein transferase SoFic [Lacticaseibacillus paracasei]|uniref:Fic family protein n=1 Tax=Lacticaseibacillus paracasei TaxID=1597 RepID=UPI000F0B6BB7|nr:Fic family protein [Lacticaseibacillus paracasei]RNE24887.1 Adenosine monophosphate-protein transferase SoFic [Lacticaseibacillus paracasei]
MSYKTLRILSYDQNVNLYDEYHNRFNGPSAIVTNLTMSPNEHDHKSSKHFPIFCVITPSIMIMQQEIMQKSRQITSLRKQLPKLASDQFFYKTLTKELISTNEIEGVRSSKREMLDAIASAVSSMKKSSRFHSLAYMYLGIREGRSIKINNPEEVREIWNQVTAGEVSKGNQPDGKIFRSEPVYINDKATGKAIHWPYSDERMVIRDINDLIEFMNNDDIPYVIKALISHFFFEYIHPFYDGNGRTGRYLACAYLGKKLDYLTGVNFSYSIIRDKNNYYKAFEEVESPKNFGDLTYFVESLMKMINKGQDTIITDLLDSKRTLNLRFNQISNSSFSKQEKAVLCYLIQPYIFGSEKSSTLDDNEIMELMKTSGFNGITYSKLSTKGVIDGLEKDGWTKLIKERPKIHMVTSKLVKHISEKN